jgi:hypothetical protein
VFSLLIFKKLGNVYSYQQLKEFLSALSAAGTPLAKEEAHKLNAQRKTIMVNTQLFQTLQARCCPKPLLATTSKHLRMR